jgi:DUF1680 family protein
MGLGLGLLLVAAAPGSSGVRLANAPKAAIEQKVKSRFTHAPLDQQRIRGLLGERMRVNVESRLARLDPAVLLAGFRMRPARQPALAETAGRSLEAATNAWVYSGDERLKTLVDRLAAELIATQAADGYLGVYGNTQRWAGADLWVQRANLEGLLRYHEATGNAAALAAARKLGDLLDATFGQPPAKRFLLAVGPHSGLAAAAMLGPMAELHRMTGEARYLAWAQAAARALDAPLVAPLNSGAGMVKIAHGRALEPLTDLAALVELHRITGEEAPLKAAAAAWKDIVMRRLYLTGTATADERFREAGELPGEESAGVGDASVTAAWIELSRQLFETTGEPQYAEEIERTVFNALAGAQDTKTGGFSQFAPMVGRKRPAVTLSVTLANGVAAIAALPQLVWGVRDDGPAVVLYAPGEATIPVREGLDVALKSETRFPADGAVALAVRPPRAAAFPLYLRVPAWSTKFTATVKDTAVEGRPGQFLKIERTWTPGDVVQIQMDLPVRVVPGGKNYADFVAVMRGPQALALETPLNPQVPYPHRAAPKSIAATGLTLTEAKPQVYTIEGLASGRPAPLTLVPFADAVQYRVWLARPDRMQIGAVAVTAFGRESWSRGGSELGSICDERPETYRDTFEGRAAAKLDWYAVETGAPVEISRVMYRHGRLFSNGGWFDTSEGKPQIQIKRERAGQWETVATLDSYPATTATTAPGLRDGEPYQVRLPQPVKAVGLRIVGKPGQSFSSCAELAGYDK